MSKYAKSYEKMLYNTLIFIVVAGRIERQNLMASLALGGGGWGGNFFLHGLHVTIFGLTTSVVKLEELPNPFTKEDYLDRRKLYGLGINGDPWGTIRSWRRRGCIVQNEDCSYTKIAS